MPHITPLLIAGGSSTTGGAETQIFLLARELGRRGYRVGVICFPSDADLPQQLDGISIVTRPPPDRGRSRLLGKLFELLTIWRTLRRLSTPVLVQRSAGFTTGAVAIVARLRRIRFVYSSSNVVDFNYADLDPIRRNRILFHLGVRLSDLIIVQTPEQAELCRHTFDRDPVIIKSIAEPAVAATATPEAFLWVGRLTFYKRPQEYLDLARALPQATFWMVAPAGEQHGGLDPTELIRAADELPNVQLLAPRPRTHLMDLIDRAVAMVNTSDYEGMPNVFLEAWAKGVPALALFHDPDGVIAREGLGFFAAGSTEVFVRSAARLWAEQADRRRLSARCRNYVAREHGAGVVAEQWTAALRLRPLGGARELSSAPSGPPC